ncbi:MAG: hypothetical protein Q4F15_04610 [Bacillota bacterium]|nr:hypothetical protein [Bacillota bacterium]
MKKGLGTALTLLGGALLVCSCSLFPSLNSSSSAQASSSQLPQSSATSSSKAAHQFTGEKTEIAYTYKDYIENNAYTLSSCPLSGSPRILVIPMWFTDSSRYITSSTAKSNVISDIQNSFFGDESSTGWESVSSYYNQLSGGELTLSGTVSDWYECGYSTSKAGRLDSADGLVEDAVTWYFQNNTSESRSDYDLDGDGYLDGVILIYGAPDYSSLNQMAYSNLWAYVYWLQGASRKKNPVANAYLWASYDFMYDAETSKQRSGTAYGTGDNSNCQIDAHTYIHEMGHVFGLDDYYDYSNTCSPAGDFSMQDCNIGGHDPFSTLSFGWADPYIPTESISLTINDFQSSRDLILLTPEWNSYDSPYDEYLLLELYSPTGLNELDASTSYMDTYTTGASKVGIRLWHVDARLTYLVRGSAGYSWSTDLTNNPEDGEVYVAMTNTYSGSDYVSVLGSSYANYNFLQLLRNSTSATYNNGGVLQNSDLFYEGDSFSMSTYSRQFYRNGHLNDGSSLGWEFSVDSITDDGDGSYSATIKLTRE